MKPNSGSRSVWASIVVTLILVLFKGNNVYAEDIIKISESIYTLKVEVIFESGETEVIGLHSTAEASYLFLPSGVKSWHICNIDFEDMISTEDGTLSFYNASTDTLEERPFVLMESSNIGSVFVDTKGVGRAVLDSVRKRKYDANIKIMNEDGYFDTDNQLKFIRTRGNGSFRNAAKKAYEFKFEEKTTVLGMRKAKKWVLLANYYDNSLVRNSLIFDFARKYTKLYSPCGRFVDVYIDGEYRGNYYLCEKVEVDKNRVEITEQNKDEITYEDITGGYLVCLFQEGMLEDDQVYFKTKSGALYVIESPDEPTEEQIQYISDLFNELEDAVTSRDGYSPTTGRHYTELLDLNSYCEKYLVEQMFMNYDLNNNSQYYYKDIDSIDSKIHAGPVWDYDQAIIDVYPPQQFVSYYLSEDIFKFDEAKELLQRKYESVFKPYVLENLKSDLDYKGRLISASYLMNREKYMDEYNSFSHGYATYGANEEFIIDMLNERIEYMDAFLYGEMNIATIDFGFFRERRLIGEEIGLIADKVNNWFQIFNGWRNVDTGEKITEKTIVDGDIIAEAEYIDLSYLLNTPIKQLQEDNIDMSYINVSNLEKIEKVLRRMKDAE